MEIPETVVNIHRCPPTAYTSADTQYIMSFLSGPRPPPKLNVIWKEFRLKSLQKRPLNSRLEEEQTLLREKISIFHYYTDCVAGCANTVTSKKFRVQICLSTFKPITNNNYVLFNSIKLYFSCGSISSGKKASWCYWKVNLFEAKPRGAWRWTFRPRTVITSK